MQHWGQITTWGLLGNYFDNLGSNLGILGDYFRSSWGLVWDYFGTTCAAFGHHFGMTWVLLGYNLVTSCHNLGTTLSNKAVIRHYFVFYNLENTFGALGIYLGST